MRLGLKFLFASVMLAPGLWAQTITTVAGNGTLGLDSGDGGPATSAVIGTPLGVAVDSAGNIFIADGLSKLVRKVNTSGTISTYAGSFTFNLGDGGPATSASLGFIGTSPHQGIAVDKAGNLYITDEMHNRIRKVDANGIITTVAGNGTLGFSGDGGPATSAELTNPTTVTVDSAGNLYIADTFNGRVRKVDTNGMITTIAGSGLGFVLNDGGPATGTQFEPIDVAMDGAGNIYIVDIGNSKVRKVSGGIITSVANGVFNGIAVDAVGNVFLAVGSGMVEKLNASGNLTTVAGGGTNNPGDGGPATSAVLSSPAALAIDSQGNIYIADSTAGRVRKVNTASSGGPPSVGGSAPVITAVQNAFGDGTTISPNMWLAIKGTNLAPPGDARIWGSSDFANNQLPTQLDGVSATVNGYSAFVYYISSTQVSILTPYYALSGSAPVQLTVGGVQSNVMTVQTANLAPSFFTFDGVNVVGTHLDGSLLGPATLYPGLSTPAKPGETVVIYGNGFGNTSTPQVNGSETQSGNLPALPVLAIGGNVAGVGFAGLISPGLFQFNVTVSPAVASGNAVLRAIYGGVQTQTGVVLAVQP